MNGMINYQEYKGERERVKERTKTQNKQTSLLINYQQNPSWKRGNLILIQVILTVDLRQNGGIFSFSCKTSF